MEKLAIWLVAAIVGAVLGGGLVYLIDMNWWKKP